jgi:hypothetical protein
MRNSDSVSEFISKPEDEKESVKCIILSEINEEMEKWNCNIPNGFLGMMRDICILLTKWFKNDVDLVEVSLYIKFKFVMPSSFALILNSFHGSNISLLRIFVV